MSVVGTYRRVEQRCMAVLAPWVFLVVPGVALHELVHAAAGRRYGAVSVDWTRPHVDVDWPDQVPVWGVVGFYLGPMAVGGLCAFALPVVFPLVPVWVDAWLVVNWVLLAGPSVLDGRGLVYALAG
jgi:hypothetical protein